MSKGRGWYNMPMAEMTEEKKNDLMVIQMRKVLDPKRFYKGPDIRGALPKYVQVWRSVALQLKDLNVAVVLTYV